LLLDFRIDNINKFLKQLIFNAVDSYNITNIYAESIYLINKAAGGTLSSRCRILIIKYNSAVMNGDRIWESLKMNILTLSGIESIEPKDCKILSLSISKATKKNVSETTFKRIFGFASAKNSASLYTRNALAQYCGYTDWEDYMQSSHKKGMHPRNVQGAWAKMEAETNKVNFFTLSAVKNKAIIPFNKMIEREFIHNHFDAFDKSDALATVISAPTGYGKTIAICQWVTHKLSKENSGDLFLYLNSSFLLSSLKTSVNLEYWMMKMVGLDPAYDFQELSFNHDVDEGKFYFVIDGFDEFMFNKNQFEVLKHLLLDILSIYKTSKWFKMVILMRDSTWVNWHEQLVIDKSSWFLGEMNDHGQNFGLLTIAELSKLMHMERPFTERELFADDFLKLRYPLFHFYFYKKYNTIIRHAQFNEVLLYELATDYMRQNVLSGNQALHKLEFIFHLLSKMEWIAGIYKADKAKIALHRKGLINTYSSLIQIGLISESISSAALDRRVYIKFIHHHFLGCCVAALIQKDNPDFSLMKLEFILLRWSKDVKLKFCILKWCLFQIRRLETRQEWIKGYQENLAPEDLIVLQQFMLQMEVYGR